jgi:hypothetical protein
VKRRARPVQEERRKSQVEVNLLAEADAGRSGPERTTRGCSLPFLGGGGLLILAIEVIRAGLG